VTARERTEALGEQLGVTVDELVAVIEEIIDRLGRTVGGILDGPPPRR